MLEVGDIIGYMEKIAPRALAETWDNVGLQVGSRHWPVRLMWVALDPDPRVIDAAVRAGVDLIITHHPLIMDPLKRIDLDTPGGAALAAAIEHRVAIFSAHTNFDAVSGGTNDILARCLGLDELEAFIPRAAHTGAGPPAGEAGSSAVGIGRKGRLAAPHSLAELGARLKAALATDQIRMVGDAALEVQQVALCTGSGGSLVNHFISSDAQAYITGDVKYHQAREIEIAGKGLLDIGHFASEHLAVEPLVKRLQELVTRRDEDLRIEACRLEQDPFDNL